MTDYLSGLSNKQYLTQNNLDDTFEYKPLETIHGDTVLLSLSPVLLEALMTEKPILCLRKQPLAKSQAFPCSHVTWIRPEALPLSSGLNAAPALKDDWLTLFLSPSEESNQ